MYRVEDIATARKLWIPVVKVIMEVCRPFSNYGTGFIDAGSATVEDPLPIGDIRWLDAPEREAEPLLVPKRATVLSVGFDVADGELWGILKLAAPPAHLDRLLEVFDEGKLLVFHNSVDVDGKKRIPKYVSLVIAGIVGMHSVPGSMPHVSFTFDPEDVVVKEELL